MALLVVAYPELAPADFRRIQDYRRTHDAQHSLVDPHFTLVFPVDGPGLEQFVTEARRQAADEPVFDFELTRGLVNAAPGGDLFHEFLVPEKGAAELIRAHERLYAGLLAPYRRADIPFIPHITVGSGGDAAAGERRLARFCRDSLPMAGTIRALSAIEVRGERVIEVARFPLRER